MDTSKQRATLSGAKCEIRFDALTRRLYATDASIYQVEPLAVAFPKNTAEAVAAFEAATEANVPIIPRGAGSGLAGGALGEGLVVDFSRYFLAIDSFNPERRTVRVQTGVVLDQLNAFLKPHGFRFGPDVATSARATVGGMIGNNSSGANVPLYGTTIDHVRAVEVLFADGRTETLTANCERLDPMRRAIDGLLRPHEAAIRERFHERMIKRWPGYSLDDYVRSPGDLTKLISGSEGTLVAVTAAELDVVPIPKRSALGLVFFDSVMEAMQASVALLPLRPAAIEHVDRVLFDQTRGQLPFKAARNLLQLDELPCEAILIVEFIDDYDDALAAFEAMRIGARKRTVTSAAEMNQVWLLRKAGLSLLTGCKGSAKPAAGIEDVAVPPERLADYVGELQTIMKRLGLAGSFYGHAASGLLHVRPVVDLHNAGDLKKFRQIADEVAALVKQFKGSLAGEHGVGIARTEYLRDQIGADLVEAMHGIKTLFDPCGLMNPGKIIDQGRFKFDRDLRCGAASAIVLPFEPLLAFAQKDASFAGNLEQCNGCGGCRKAPPTMCPTYIATGDEIMSTRGRANVLRAVFERTASDRVPLGEAELSEALDYCLSCRACATECPSNVNMALLKAELLHARNAAHGLSFAARLMSNPDRLGRVGCAFAGLANATLTLPWLRKNMEKALGIARERPLPAYAKQRFDRWFKRRTKGGNATRGRVYLWDDTFVRYHDPHIGRAAVAVLEAAGFDVALIEGRRCCGRPAFSFGRLDKARELGAHNLRAIPPGDAPILFLEPSCQSMFAEDYRELGLDTGAVAARCLSFETFIDALLAREPNALEFAEGYSWIALHGHCHTKAITGTEALVRLAKRLPNAEVALLDTGCCGMAGAFGMMKTKYTLSRKIAKPLVNQIDALRAGTQVVAGGASCRHQIDHLTPVRALHIAELLAENLKSRA